MDAPTPSRTAAPSISWTSWQRPYPMQTPDTVSKTRAAPRGAPLNEVCFDMALPLSKPGTTPETRHAGETGQAAASLAALA